MRTDTPTNCHCGAEYKGSDHCPECLCEQYEGGCDHVHDARPVYVQRLDRERRQAEDELTALQQGLTDLRIYLTSEKFSTDRTVQVADVLARVDEARAAGTDARYSVAL
jgi:hypothetical protein